MTGAQENNLGRCEARLNQCFFDGTMRLDHSLLLGEFAELGSYATDRKNRFRKLRRFQDLRPGPQPISGKELFATIFDWNRNQVMAAAADCQRLFIISGMKIREEKNDGSSEWSRDLENSRGCSRSVFLPSGS